MSERPENESLSSDRDQGSPSIDSVDDFLYADHQRIATFLAQFEDHGVPTQTTHKTSEQSQKQSKLGGRVGFRTLHVSPEKATQRQSGEELSRVFDPAWSNALSFRDLLDEHDLIQRDLDAAGIGQIVLASGHLDLADLSILKGMWSHKTVRDSVRASAADAQAKIQEAAQLGDANLKLTGPGASNQNRHQRRREQKLGRNEPAPPKQPDPTELALDVIGHMPHPVQGALSQGSNRLWFSLKSECLTVSTGDLLLKHGSAVSGVWSVLGILDAKPDHMSIDERIARVMRGGLSPALGLVLMQLAPATRALLGRPEDAYGVTPLLIYREVGGKVT